MKLTGFVVYLAGLFTPFAHGEENPFEQLERSYSDKVLPLLETHCLDCHDTDSKKGELDLERFSALTDLRLETGTWQNVRQQLQLGEMPPKDKAAITPEERKALIQWVDTFLDAEARANAGDPGPVVLRRLSNAEYTYTVRDLTGVDTLDPAREFPVDGAAGEGFTNTGDALAMSPALFDKYFAAGKEIAAHAVLLPHGFRFSNSATRRDWSNAIVERIRRFYHRRLHAKEVATRFDTKVQVGAVKPMSVEEGRVDYQPYLRALLDPGRREERVNERYLKILREALTGNVPASDSRLLDDLRKEIATASLKEVPSIAEWIEAWQDELWRFQKVGHLGIIDPWQVPQNPLGTRRDFQIKLESSKDQTISLISSAVSADAKTAVRWEHPRIVRPGKAPIPLAKVRAIASALESVAAKTRHHLAAYLEMAFELKASAPSAARLQALAEERGLDLTIAASLMRYLGIVPSEETKISGYLTDHLTKVGGYEAINGWTIAGQADLSLLSNASDSLWRIPGEAHPHSIFVHPRPERWIAAGWRSPITSEVDIKVKVIDRHGGCGNGVSWALQHRSGNRLRTLQAGTYGPGGRSEADLIEDFRVQEGDLISLVIDARDGNHACDLTSIELVVTEPSDEKRVWSLAADCADTILAGNPHADQYGHLETWHFYSGLREAKGEWQVIPKGSMLDQWLETTDVKAASALGEKIQSLVTNPLPASANPENGELRRQLSQLSGPLFSELDLNALAARVEAPQLEKSSAGLHPSFFSQEGHLIQQSPHALPFQIPADLFGECQFVVSAVMDDSSDDHAAAQIQVTPGLIDIPNKLLPNIPVTTAEGSPAAKQLERAFSKFRELFPAAMCYARVVPIDEVVTLVIYHREDRPLIRLMLDDSEQRELDALWEELRFVGQDAFLLETGLEQILEFATQDADPSRFYPLQEPIAKASRELAKRLRAAEPAQLEALIRFAGKAYRRPLSNEETHGLRALYHRLRAEGIHHDEAFRLTLARVFASPAFLYRSETPAAGEVKQGPVSSLELATRLSYFLWSSMPDEGLMETAVAGRLQETEALLRETRRLLDTDRIRRLAIHFACQWLHIRDFDKLDEKSERHFPEFATLRGPMYEEAIQFFTDFFRSNGSILDLLNADHTYVNGELAHFYDLPSEVQPNQWQRVEGMRDQGRGGILGMASTLARHSGASRTSPILRGNWVVETLLGEPLPKPPQGVPPLPETLPEGLSEREMIERHRADPACAHCHQRIDPYGFTLEGFDAIGRSRERDTRTEILGGRTLEGLDGLRDYLANERREAFVRQFARKLLGYALGRSVRLSDEPLLDQIIESLPANDYAVHDLVERIVLSPQFREIRGQSN